MANPEHLKILKQGVKAWNKWRRENPTVTPDLINASLHKANLLEVYLRGANLRGANLSRTRLQRAVLSEANLRQVNLSQANLTEAELWRVILSDADLDKTLLYGADLREADLTGAGLFKAVLRLANLRRAKLKKADVSEAVLHRADLTGVELCEALLIETDLMEANLFGANLKEANLRDADLRFSNLITSNLSGVILTGAKLFGTARDNWVIKDVKCKYVYWDEQGNERLPKNRDLEPGEFERLYAALPTIEYIFENGMTPIDPVIMDRVVQAIRERQPVFDIKIDSINARGLAPSIKFTVQHEDHKEPALAEVGKEYQVKQAQLEGKLEEISKHIGNLIDRPNTINIINAPQAKYLAIDGSTLNVEETSNYYAWELRKVIAEEPEGGESFAEVAKNTALDIVGEAIKEIAKGQVKNAAKEIIKLGKDLGPLLVRTAPAAYEFFRSIGT